MLCKARAGYNLKGDRFLRPYPYHTYYRTYLYPLELELELIQTQMAQKPMLRADVGMRVRCANKASAE